VDGTVHNSRWEAAEPLGESLGDPLDKLESVVTAQDTELRRTRTELELRNLYVAELHAVLKRQAEQLEQLTRRLERLEAGRKG
jgi:uncharacterized coiled-coil protein SlyX